MIEPAAWTARHDPAAIAAMERLLDDLGLDRYTQRVADRLDVTFESNPFQSLDKKILIACAARTGSNFFCDHLRPHGALVGEYFRPPRIQTVCDRRGLESLEDFCKVTIDQFARRGVFGVKGAEMILVPLILAHEIPPFLSQWRVVYLYRKDTLKQAISHVIAEKTGSFRSTMPGRELQVEEYDGKQIAEFVRRHIATNARWEIIFSTLGLDPMRMSYEDVAADPSGMAARAAVFFDLHGPPVPEQKSDETILKKQASELNAIWEARFREEMPEVCAAIPEMV